ncbi:hypothetical protein OUZ56_016489 [Daphnia magna]|uniref:Uncharacterized protein n=1 Tax=Daphnia magna TaxID=35525 RepID=A0ABR0AQQ3_9CRUS|nr:hypothetical protein OUZ56_016489 [Daphnia magna]
MGVWGHLSGAPETIVAQMRGCSRPAAGSGCLHLLGDYIPNNTYDLATLEKKLSKLTQKPEENCIAFVSRQLVNKVKKMRDHRKSKILLQGLLSKYKAELYLRMPENTENFDALCKQLFISENILHTKEATDDREMSAVIADITHHEKQQDDKIQLLEQKLSEALSELKYTNTKRGSPQEDNEKKKAAEVQPNAPQFVAPRHTPTIVCFLRTHLNQPGMVSCGRKIRECDGFMLLTNWERMELLFAQHRCFGCFLPLSVAGHLKLADCPHPHCAGPTTTTKFSAHQGGTCGQVGPLSLTVLPSRAGLRLQIKETFCITCSIPIYRAVKHPALRVSHKCENLICVRDKDVETTPTVSNPRQQRSRTSRVLRYEKENMQSINTVEEEQYLPSEPRASQVVPRRERSSRAVKQIHNIFFSMYTHFLFVELIQNF